MLFLDESGDHNLHPKKINPHYPVFVLGGVIVNRAHVRNVIEPEMRQFKQAHFGREDVILHTVDMGKGRRNYGFLANPGKRRRFYADLSSLLDQWDYQVVACVFDKPRYIQQFTSPLDPYHYGIELLVERFCAELGDKTDAGFICAEMRNPGLDRELMAAWERLKRTGTDHALSAEIDRKIIDFSLKDKQPNMAGLQLADLAVTPIGRHAVGKAPTSNEVQWEVVERKLQRVGGATGLIIRP